LCYGVVFKFVHQPSSVAFYLFGRSNRQENYFCKLLRWKRPEDAAT
jgi:hypothetical protein